MPAFTRSAPRRRSGCLWFFLILAGLVLVALVAGGYFAFQRLTALSAPDRGGVPAFTDTFNAYDPAQKKIAAFDTELEANRPASLRLSADEVNALLSRSELSLQHNIFFFSTFIGDQAQMQVSVPAEDMSLGLARGRYFNMDFEFTPSIDPRTKSLVLKTKTFLVGGKPLLGDDARGRSATIYVVDQIAAAINAEMQKSPMGRKILENGTRVAVQDGQLVIDTQ